MNQLINITQNENNDSVVSGRELHDFLEVKDKYPQWILRMTEYGFIEGEDFITILGKSSGGAPKSRSCSETGDGQRNFYDPAYSKGQRSSSVFYPS